MKTTHEPYATPFGIFMPRKPTNATLSDRGRAIAKLLSRKDGSNVSRVLEGLLLAEFVRGGRLTEQEVQLEVDRIQKEEIDAAIKDSKPKRKK